MGCSEPWLLSYLDLISRVGHVNQIMSAICNQQSASESMLVSKGDLSYSWDVQILDLEMIWGVPQTGPFLLLPLLTAWVPSL